jgi:hypothetical protein
LYVAIAACLIRPAFAQGSDGGPSFMLFFFFVVFLIITVAALVVPLAVLRRMRARKVAAVERALIELQRRLGGTIRPGLSGVPPSFEFAVAGRPARVSFLGTPRQSRHTVKSLPHTDISLAVTGLAFPLPLFIVSRASDEWRRLERATVIPVGDADFDSRFTVEALDPARTPLLLTPPVRWALARMTARPGFRWVRADGTQVVFHSKGREWDGAMLVEFVDLAVRVWGTYLDVSSRPQAPPAPPAPAVHGEA